MRYLLALSLLTLSALAGEAPPPGIEYPSSCKPTVDIATPGGVRVGSEVVKSKSLDFQKVARCTITLGP